MKRIASIIFFIHLIFIFLNSQSKVDSLTAKLNTVSKKEKVIILNELAEELSPVDPEKAIEYANDALKSAVKFKNRKEESLAYKNLADSYYYLNKIEESLEMYQKTAEIEIEISGEKSESYERRLGDVGYCYEILLKFEKAIEIYTQALKIAEELDMKEEIIILLNNIGQAYYKLADYDKALKFFRQNLKIEQKFGKPEDLSIVYNNIGMVYDAWNQFEKAIKYYEQALEIDRKYQNEKRVAIRLNNIGYAYRAVKKYEIALDYLQEALKIEKKIGRNEKIAIRLTNIGLIYISTEKYEEALKNFREAQLILEKIDLPYYQSTLYNHIGHTFILQKKYLKAIEVLEKSQKIAIEKNLKQQQIYNYLEFALLYQKMKDYKKAYQNQVSYSNLRDSVFTEEKHKQLAEFEAKYETDKKEKEIEILTKNTEIQNLKLKGNRIVKYSFIGGFIIILILAFTIYRAYRSEKIEIKKRKIAEKDLSDLNKNLEKKVEDEVRIRREQEQKAVEQSRLAALGELAAGIAHEINQPLHSIAFAIDNMKMAIEENDADKEYLQKKTKNIFSDVDRMKRIIDHIRTFSRKQTGEEKEPFRINQSISNAVNMVKEQYSNHRIKLDVDLDKNLPETLGNLYRFEQVVLILLSNGKDAVEEKAEKAGENYQKKLSIKTFQRDNNIMMEFIDNGIGISQENIDKIFNPFYTTKKTGEGTGLGLSIAFGIIGEMEGTIEVESEVGVGTRMKLELNVN